jgi:hypothetical protein
MNVFAPIRSSLLALASFAVALGPVSAQAADNRSNTAA